MTYHSSALGIDYGTTTSDAPAHLNKGCLTGMPSRDEDYLLRRMDAIQLEFSEQMLACEQKNIGPGITACKRAIAEHYEAELAEWQDRLDRLCRHKANAPFYDQGCFPGTPTAPEEITFLREIAGWRWIEGELVADCNGNTSCISSVRATTGNLDNSVMREFEEYCAAQTPPAPLAREAVPAAMANPLSPYANGCDGATPMSAAETGILSTAEGYYSGYLRSYDDCMSRYEGAISAALTARDESRLRTLEADERECIRAAGEQYAPRLDELLRAMQNECASPAPPPAPRPAPVEYPPVSIPALPGSVLVELGNGCDPMSGPSQQEQRYIDEITSLEAARRAEYSDCRNTFQNAINNAMSARASVDEVASLQGQMRSCILDVLSSYEAEIRLVSDALVEHCAAAGEPIPAPEPEPVVEEVIEADGTSAASSGRGLLIVGGIVMLVVGAGAYLLGRKR